MGPGPLSEPTPACVQLSHHSASRGPFWPGSIWNSSPPQPQPILPILTWRLTLLWWVPRELPKPCFVLTSTSASLNGLNNMARDNSEEPRAWDPARFKFRPCCCRQGSLRAWGGAAAYLLRVLNGDSAAGQPVLCTELRPLLPWPQSSHLDRGKGRGCP